MSDIDLRLGRWQDVLADVEECDAVISDPPYSPRAHAGFRSQEDMRAHQKEQARQSRARGTTGADGALVHGSMAYGSIPYDPIDSDGVREAVASWVPRVRSWFVVFGDHVTYRLWEEHLGAAGWYVFAPVVWIRTGGTPRFQGDGPANAAEWICVARPRQLTKCGSLPGWYQHNQVKGNEPEKIVTGQKPVPLMRAIIRDYTEPGDLVVDPYCGGGTTALACAIEGRRCITSEVDPDTYAKAKARLASGYTPDFF